MENIIFSPAKFDSDWDDFLEHQAAGHYTQSSHWGELKSRFGWEVHRILINGNGHILAGAQVLTKQLPVWGKIGYISKGPVISGEDSDIFDEILLSIDQFSKLNSILLLSVQPPNFGSLCEQSLHKFDYQPTSYYIIPPSTVVIDLSQTQDQILAQMKRTTRQNIRAAQTRGVTIRAGTQQDVEAFCQLKRLTESRSEFLHYDQCYYQEAWKQLAPHDHIKLWLAHHDGELLGGLMAVYFGQWVVYAWAGSSGAHPEKRPNDLLFWHAMMWGKEHGYRYCDLGGISPVVAEHLKRDVDPPDCKEKGIARYKLGFGPMITFPPSYDTIYTLRPKWLVRRAVRLAWSKEKTFLSKYVRGVSD